MNFDIEHKGEISSEFLSLGIKDFNSACVYIASLPYKRNANKHDLLCVFKDKAGKCSTKHSTLRKLAVEHHRNEVKLMLGIFKMDIEYASKIGNTLRENDLEYIPEAHNYLKINDEYFDFTKPNSKYAEIEGKILEEIEIEYNQINNEKIRIHKDFLKKWIEHKPQFNLEKIWQIREQCIADLQT